MFFLLPFTLFFNSEFWPISIFIILLVVYKHQDNIQRLQQGGE
jgi:glycerol-3-phosphate acyltransferase PlsY